MSRVVCGKGVKLSRTIGALPCRNFFLRETECRNGVHHLCVYHPCYNSDTASLFAKCLFHSASACVPLCWARAPYRPPIIRRAKQRAWSSANEPSLPTILASTA